MGVTTGYNHRLMIGGLAALAITLDHLRSQSITSVSVQWDEITGKWWLDFHHPMQNIEWALGGLRPNILPPK